MKVLFVSAEVSPFVSVGGLSQVMYFLPKALRNLGQDVRIFTAKYGAMDDNAMKNKWKFKTEFSGLSVPTDDAQKKDIICNVKSFYDSKNKLRAYFLENREYYELRANVFGYRDDHVRFRLLSQGCLEWLALQLQTKDAWIPDIIHCHDWHTAYLIDLAKRHPRYKALFKNIPIFLTVHNFAFQGNYDFRYAPPEEFDDGTAALAPFFSPLFQKQNALKRGILFADAVNTVSQTHSVEVLTPEYSEGLDKVLSEHKEKLTGILNGIDTKKFDPGTDKLIKKRFTIHSFLHAREENKKDLQKLFGLPVDSSKPLFAFCGRLDKQKGLDLLLQSLPPLLKERPDVQIIFVGSGDERYRLELTVLQKQFKSQIALHLRADFRLPPRVYAGADMVLIPSLFEPGGIVTLEALRYGCVPIVRRTGGLNDIITDFDPNKKQGNGLSFHRKDPWSLYGVMIEALTLYKHPKLWQVLVKNALSCDFSWGYAAEQYDTWYKRIVKKGK